MCKKPVRYILNLLKFYFLKVSFEIALEKLNITTILKKKLFLSIFNEIKTFSDKKQLLTEKNLNQIFYSIKS